MLYIIHSEPLDKNRTRVLQLKDDKLELCVYPNHMLPESGEHPYADKFKVERFGDNFKIGDFADGYIGKGNVVTYRRCDSRLRNIFNKAFGFKDNNTWKND